MLFPILICSYNYIADIKGKNKYIYIYIFFLDMHTAIDLHFVCH